MGQFIKPDRETIDRTLDNIERDDSLQDLQDLEKQMQDFLNEKGNDPGFEFTKEHIREIEQKNAEEIKILAAKRDKHLAENRARHNPIGYWQAENTSYVIKHINTSKTRVENQTPIDISLEFVDFLIGKFLEENIGKELRDIFNNASAITVLGIIENGKDVILGIETVLYPESNKSRRAGLIFGAYPEFKLKLAEIVGGGLDDVRFYF